MLNLSGQIATLNQNSRQIGGLYDWQTNVVMNYTTKDGVKEFKPVKRIEAQSYWILEKIKSNEFDAEFFMVQGGQLILIDKGNVVIDLPDTQTLDRRLYAPIEVRWLSVTY